MSTPRTPAPAPRTRPASVPPLPAVDVPVPHWPALDTARRRLDKVQSATGRVATVAGAGVAAAGLVVGGLTMPFLLADAALVGAGLVSLRLWKPHGQQRATATALYAMPGVGLAALLVAERLVAAVHPGEALGLLVWTAGTWVLRPARLARRMLVPPPPAPAPAPVVQVTDGHPAARWWAGRVAVDGGVAPGTVLEDIQRTGDASIRAVIRSTVDGRPVPEVSIRHLSALMDVPEDQITIGPVPGRGACVRLLTIGRPQAGDDPASVWERRIAPLAMPGATLTGVRVGNPGTPTTREEDA